MKIFVTGGTGFIGRHLMRALQRDRHQLLLLTTRAEKDMTSIRHPRTAFVRGNLKQLSRWEGAVKRFRPDAAVHLAWEGLGIPDYGPAMSQRNLEYGLKLYEFLGRIGCKRILTTGTCWEYGNVIGKVNETMGVRPLNAFSAAKNALHALGVEIAKIYRMHFFWARLFFVYGPGQRSASLIPYLIKCRRTGTEPVLKNPFGGNDFVFVTDVAEAIAQILAHCRLPEATYNIGSGRLTSVQEVVDVLFRRPRRPNHYRRARGFYADTKAIRRDIGWQPKINLMKGVTQTLSATNE